MEPDLTDGLSDAELADLVRLVDGTLPPGRRTEVEARVATSARLRRIVERQGIALDALRRTAETGAPARLRAQVERRRTTGRQRAARRRRAILAPALAVAAAAAVALVVVLPGSTPPVPSVADAAVLAKRPPTRPAPGTVPGTPQLLRAKVGAVRFPNYSAKFGWKPMGARHDRVLGRDATTVFYAKGRRTLAYTIVSGAPLDAPPGATATTRGGVEFRTVRSDGRPAVTWERGGHTCVLSGSTARPAELIALADWRGEGAVLF